MKISCPNWSTSPNFFRGRCAAGKFAGRPTLGQCVDLCLRCDRSELAAYMAKLAAKQITAAKPPPVDPAALTAARAICDNCPEHKIRGCCGGEVRACPFGMPFDILNSSYLPPCEKLKNELGT